MRKSGMEFKEIAKELGLTYDAVYHRYKKYVADYLGHLRTKTEVWSRAVGYLRPIEQWNDAKQEEFKDRVNFDKQLKDQTYANDKSKQKE